jgi:formylglycine-generating enzyme required for sulfatase activity
MNPEVTKPQIPDHQVLRVIGRGAYGEIWLARSLTGALRAVKVVYRSTFESERSFNREFEGMSSFEPISRAHEGFVNILHVGRAETFFYYIMELADDCEHGQHIDAAHYKPKTLKSELEQRKRLPAEECIQLGLLLTDALRALHAKLLAHRDIKPANIIFVNGKPKLADIGLVAVSGQRSFVGTEGYVPHEGPGTPQADIYSLGKVLYEISMGKDRLDFPEVSTSLDEMPDKGRLLQLNRVLLKACANEPAKRYENAEHMHDDLALLNGVKRKKSGAGLGVVAAVACMLMLAVWIVFHFLPKYRTGVPTTALIKTDPPGAMVFLGDRGSNSPAEFRDVDSGNYKLHIMKPGFDPVDMQVEISPGVALPVVKLSRSKGSLQITTQPGGATFELHSDTEPARTGTAPATLAGLPTGTYELTAQKDGRELKESVEIKRDEVTTQELVFAWGSVAVTSEPEGAEIFADGKSQGVAPVRIDLPTGKHMLAAKYQDWTEDTREVTIEHGKDAAVDFEFAYGSVKITSEPHGASVMQGGKEIGLTTLFIENVKPGKVSYELQMNGYKPVVVTGTVTAKEQTFLAERLQENQGPEHGKVWRNTLGMKFSPVGDILFCTCKTRTKDYDAFCAATGRQHEKPDFDQTEDHPVVKVNWYDAQAFCKWLTEKEHAAKILEDGQSYRLPTDQEWSFAVGLPDEGGSTPEERDGKIKNEYPWGKAWPPPPGAGNYADLSARKLHVPIIDGYEDGFAQTSPVGSFPANRLGLYDMGGNVWEWVQDDYKGGGKDWGVLRGGSWANSSRAELQSSYRNVVDRADRDVIYGFRCVLMWEKPGGQGN